MAAVVVMNTGSLLAGVNVWTRLAPATGPVTAIAIDPQDSTTLYLASGAGLFQSGDSGATWSLVNPRPTCCISTLAIDPQTPSTIYALTRDGGVLKSIDRGSNWIPANLGLPVDAGGRYRITSLVIDPENASALYTGNALPGGGVFKTTDGGESWDLVNSGLPAGGIVALAINPQDPAMIYAIAQGNFGEKTGGVYKSTDGGTSWTAVNAGLDSNAYYVSILAIDPSNPDMVYVSGYDTGLYQSTNGGANWSPAGYGMTAPGYGRTADTVIALPFDPRDSNIVYAGTSAGTFKSRDRGASWSAVRSRQTSDASGPLVVSALAVDPQNPDTVYAIEANSAVFKSADAGASWTAVYSEPAAPTGLTVLRIDPQNPQTMYAGTPVGIYKATDGGSSWAPVNSGVPSDGNGQLMISTLAIDPQSPSTIYAIYVGTSAYTGGFCCGGGIVKSTDGGANWSILNTALQGSDNYCDCDQETSGLAIDPQNPNIVYVGNGSGVMKTTDGGASWKWVNSGFPSGPNQHLAITTLAIDPQNPGTLYAGAFLNSVPGSAVFKSTNGGEAKLPGSWTNVGLSGFYFAAILGIDEQIPGTVYVRAASANAFLLFKTANGGASWNDVNSGLPSSVTALAIDPRISATVYAATNSGVFRSIDGGLNWTPVNSGLTTLSVSTLAIHPQNPDTVYAGILDGSVFAMTFAPEL